MATSYDFVVDVSNQNDDWRFIATVLRLGVVTKLDTSKSHYQWKW